MNWKLWGRGLIAAIVGGAASAAGAWQIDSGDFNLESGLSKLCRMAGIGAAIGAFAYLKNHPVPDLLERVANVVKGESV